MEHVYRTLRPLLLARCFQILLSASAAQDAAQDVFVRTMRRGIRFRSEDDARRYMMRAAHNVSLNMRRSNMRLASLPEGTLDEWTIDAEPTYLASQFVEALRFQCGAQDVDVANRCLLDLESQSAVADDLGCNRRTIYNRIRRLKAAALQMLE